MTGSEASATGIPDDLLLGGLFGNQSVGGSSESWQTAWRSGHLLALARRQKGGLANILRFYRALRPAGRAYRSFMSQASRGPMWRILPSRSFPTEGFVRRFENDTGHRVTGMLFGNPVQRHRRVILHAEAPGEPVWLLKVGFSPEAVAAIRREQAILGEVDGKLPNVPPIAYHLDEAGIAAVGTTELAGKPMREPERHLDAAVELLSSWTRFGETRPLADFAAWPDLADALRGQPAAWLERLGRLPLTPAFSHGDFAAWNLLVAPGDGRVVAVDWEWAECSGVPGWDLVHLFCQQAAMVMKADGDGMVRHVIHSLRRPIAADYLRACGWPSAELALATYTSRLNPIFDGPRGQSLERLLATPWP